MTPKSRSLSGAALMLVLIPIFAGLLACMPVPIGNPERSRIDPELTGVWAVIGTEEFDSEAAFYVFEPYDKRTWLVIGIGIVEGGDVDLEKYDFSSYAGYENLASNEMAHIDHVSANQIVLFKAWSVKLAGEQFFTWEPKGLIDSLGEDPEYWMVQKITKTDESTLVLNMVNGESEPFKDLKKTRRAYERVLKKHVDDPVIYDDFSEDLRITLVRAEGPVLKFFENVADIVISD